MTVQGFVERHPFGRWSTNFVLIVCLVVGLGVAGKHFGQANVKARYDFCVEVEQVRTYARDSASRALKSLPTLAYYKHHPAERAQALKDIQRQVDFFSPPLDCRDFSHS